MKRYIKFWALVYTKCPLSIVPHQLYIYITQKQTSLVQAWPCASSVKYIFVWGEPGSSPGRTSLYQGPSLQQPRFDFLHVVPLFQSISSCHCAKKGFNQTSSRLPAHVTFNRPIRSPRKHLNWTLDANLWAIKFEKWHSYVTFSCKNQYFQLYISYDGVLFTLLYSESSSSITV